MSHQSRDTVAIDELGLIGDTRTAALVGPMGTVEWLCLPRFDSEPVFGGLVGGYAAGDFTVRPAGDGWTVTGRRYRERSAVLETTWSSPVASVVLTEAMVPEVAGRLLPPSLLVRRVEVLGAPVEISVRFAPRARVNGREQKPGYRDGWPMCTWGPLAIALTTTLPRGVPVGQTFRTTVDPGRPAVFALSAAYGEPVVFVDPVAAADLLEETDAWWRDWCRFASPDRPFAEYIVRSAITLRLLTYAPSGAPVAAPTTSLPEEIGGERNWDYRFAWARDASISTSAFLRLGHTEEASGFLHWLLHAGRLSRPNLAPMFTLDGTTVPDEILIEGWPGYCGSPPVRIGNSAAGQHQLDAYGWVIDAVWDFSQRGGRVFGELWRMAAGLADTVAERWIEPDAGIWEVRGPQQHYVHSKLMAWLALDRAVRLASQHRTRSKRVMRWRQERDRLAHELKHRGFDQTRNRYRRSYGSDDLDAAVLLLPVVGFEPADSLAVRGTIDAISKGLSAGGPLLYRYPPGRDNLEGGEGAFLVCSFWWVQALAATGQIDEAGRVLAELTDLATPLGLFGEEIEPSTGAHLGNFPLAFSHATFLQAALSVQEAIELG